LTHRLRPGALVLLAVLLLAGGCRQAETASGAGSLEPARQETAKYLNPQECVETFDPSKDYFPEKVEFHYAEQIAVEYFSHYKVVTIKKPWTGADRGERNLLLLCGTPRPPGWDGVPVLEIPARTLVTTSTTELPHVVRLGLVDRLVGHDELDWVTSPEIRRRIDAGKLLEVGGGPGLNVELVLEAAPDLLLSDSLGDPEVDLLGKLREAQVPVALAPSFLETSPLGRAEWIKHTALFFDRERRAEEVFSAVAKRYEELAAKVRRAFADAPGRKRPTVLTNGPIGDTWWTPGGRSYLALLVADAGGDYLWSSEPSTGSVPLDLESVYERAVDAEVWIQPGSWHSLEEIRAVDARLADFAAFRNRRVYNYDRRLTELGGNDYWENGTARPDQVLADLVHILHPDLLPEHELIYHRRLPDRAP
jgi:cobalamin transport system substrate-binding protein